MALTIASPGRIPGRRTVSEGCSGRVEFPQLPLRPASASRVREAEQARRQGQDGVRSGSVTSEAYMRFGGRFDSLPVRRWVHTPVLGSQSQTSARPAAFGASYCHCHCPNRPPTRSGRAQGPYAMAWPCAGSACFPVVVRSVQIDCAGSHSQVSFIEMPPAEACSFCIPPNKTARLRLLSRPWRRHIAHWGAAAGAS